jgi:hypothetical protein
MKHSDLSSDEKLLFKYYVYKKKTGTSDLATKY